MTSRLLSTKRIFGRRFVLCLHRTGCLVWLTVRVARDTDIVIQPATDTDHLMIFLLKARKP